jgi:hypothetical protein
MEMTSNPTSAKATTSARRMTGGCSLGLSGTGEPMVSEGRRSPDGRSLDKARTTSSPPARGTIRKRAPVFPIDHAQMRFAVAKPRRPNRLAA